MTLTKESNGLRKKQVDEDVERLKDWLEKQPHLPHDVDNTLLRSFVTGTKGLEIAKQKLDAWFSYKGKVPQLFSDAARNPLNPDFKKQSKACQLFFLPKLTPDGYLVQWLKVGPEMDLFNHPQKIARLTMQIELAMLLYPENKGYMTVYDLENLPASVLTRLSASCTAAGLQWFQLAMPLKLKKAVIFNSIPVVDVVMNTIIKPFLKEKLFKRISVTSDDASSLKNHLPIEMLPSEYGGSEKSSDELNAEWEKKLEEKADWFRETAKLVSDEKKRPADKTNTYGVEGTFRTLAID